MMDKEEFEKLLANEKTTLADIKAAEWYRDGNGYGGWWFTQRGTNKHVFLPRWIGEMESRAEKNAAEFARSQMRQALGLKQ